LLVAEDPSLLDRTENLIAQATFFQEAAQELREELAAYVKAQGHDLGAAAEAPAEESEEQGKDKRRSYRKQGPPVPVTLSFSKNGKDPFRGWIVDCSQTGIGVTIDWPLPEDSTLFARPVNAPPRLGWFPVQLRNCRKDRNRWHIGCQFLHELKPEDLYFFQP
jgi:hypothetical protein